MIDRSRLRDLHGVELPLHVLEQDYVQALFLQELYRETDALVFKGGTFLRHVHGLDRFSEALDCTRASATAVVDDLETAVRGLERYGLPATLEDVDRRSDAVLARLRYEGPLFDGTDRSRGSIEVDVSTRTDVVREPEWRRLFVPYPETRAVTVRCLAIEEALAEKLRALSTRSRGRDLYDCWFLLGQDVAIDPDLFERKMDVLGEPARVSVSVTEREWNRDLSILLDRPPAYDDVYETVVDAINAAGLSVGTDRS
jgi:predicted nucleotidyltransferase component of viral defense system